jgi:hypothetical protein
LVREPYPDRLIRRRDHMKQYLDLKSSRTILALFLIASVISLTFVVAPPSASAAPAVLQCNGTDNVGYEAVECDYKVTNVVDNGVTSSTVESKECHGSTTATLTCSTSVVTSPDLVTSIDQCNGSGNGGYGRVVCNVEVINMISGAFTTSPATVNQCVGSGGGGGTEPTITCQPYPAIAIDATVDQCNGSGEGGGATLRVDCIVDSSSTVTSIIPVTIDQCNGSGNGGNATVTCRAIISTVLIAPPPATTTTVAATTTTAPATTTTMPATTTTLPATTTTVAATTTTVAPVTPGPGPPAPPTTTTLAPAPPTTTTLAAVIPPATTTTVVVNPEPPKFLGGGGTINGTLDGGNGGRSGSGNGGGPQGDSSTDRSGSNDDSSTRWSGGASDRSTTSQITRIPRGGAAAGGGSTDGLDNSALLFSGLALIGAALPALAWRRRLARI